MARKYQNEITRTGIAVVLSTLLGVSATFGQDSPPPPNAVPSAAVPAPFSQDCQIGNEQIVEVDAPGLTTQGLAHLPYRNNRSYEDYVGLRGFERLGRKKWQKHVEIVIELLKHGLQADYVMLGGGQTKKLKSLPPGVRVGNNSHAILGGIRLWEPTVSEATNPATAKPPASAGKPSPPPA
jgi:hypothetical protein